MDSQLEFRVNSFRDGDRVPIDLVVDAAEAELTDLDDDVRVTTPITLNGHAYRDDEDVMVTLRASAGATMLCGRCANDVLDTLAADLYVMYRPESERPDFLDGEEEVGLGYYEGGIIDIREDVRRYLLLEIPLWPVCDEDCKGLCATCGANLNDDACACGSSDDGTPRTPLAEQLDRLFGK